MTFDRRVADAIELVEFLRNYLGKDKVILLAEARKYQMTLERVRAANNKKGMADLERIGPDPTRWDLGAWNTNMAWAFRTNLPTPNLDRKLLFPLALTSPIYSFRDLYTLFVRFQWSTAQMFDELKAYDARRRLGTRFDARDRLPRQWPGAQQDPRLSASGAQLPFGPRARR